MSLPKPVIRIRPKVIPKPKPEPVVVNEMSDLDAAFSSMNLDHSTRIPVMNRGYPIPSPKTVTPNIAINQDHFLEYVFMLSNEGRLNMNQVAYLTECIGNDVSLSTKLDEFNLRNSFLSWEAKLERDQQETALKASILADKVKKITTAIAAKEAELAPHKIQLESQTDELSDLCVRYRNYPDNPRYHREKTRLESAIYALKHTIAPYEDSIIKLRLELDTIRAEN